MIAAESGHNRTGFGGISDGYFLASYNVFSEQARQKTTL
jgi:hypothetical protein